MNLNNLRPENIKAGVNIGGVVGNYIDENLARLVFTSDNYGETFICDTPTYTLTSYISYKNNLYYWRIKLTGLWFKPKGVLIFWQRYPYDSPILYGIGLRNNYITINHSNGLTFSPFHGGFEVDMSLTSSPESSDIIQTTTGLHITAV